MRKKKKKRTLICPKTLCLLLNKYKGSEVYFYVPLPFRLRLTFLCLRPNAGRAGGGESGHYRGEVYITFAQISPSVFIAGL